MALSVRRLNSFLKDYQGLKPEGKARVEKTLRLLIQNPRHPSLQVKRIQGTPNIWEVRVDLKHRITFQWEGDLLVLRRIGSHDIIDKEAKRGAFFFLREIPLANHVGQPSPRKMKTS